MALLAVASVRASDLPPADQVLSKMRLVNGWFMQQVPDPGKDIITDQRRPSNIWTRGVYYEGLTALSEIDPDPRFTTYAVNWAQSHHWGLRHGVRTRSADDQCCGQTYLALYLKDRQPERIRDIKASVDAMVASSATRDWFWIDAFQMAMPVFAQLGVVTADPKYFEKMHALYVTSRDGSAASPGLFNPKTGLWWRDRSFTPPYKELNGSGCYWSRGNGWVMAALVRVLEIIPQDAPGRKDYADMLVQMAQAVAKVQRPDGFWNVSLADPDDFGGKEVTGTALFTFGLAGGVRLGILPSQEYSLAISKAWNAMASQAVHPDGFLGYVQGTGKQPSDSQPVTYDRAPDFKDFAVGCFLLAGSEVYRMAEAPPPAAARP